MTKAINWLKQAVNKIVNPDNQVKQEPAPVLTPISDIENIINQAIKGDYSKLDEIVENIANYKDRFIMLDPENRKNFCSQQLNLDIQNRSDHRYIHSNILSHYNLNEQLSELVLLAIAANNQLAEKYHEVLFAEENLSLLPLLVGGEQYISEFIKRFPTLYQKLKEKIITVSSGQTIGFFSVIAANKYQGLLEAVLVQKDDLTALKDLKSELQNAKNDPLYGVLEVAAMVENIGFIDKVLKSIEQDISNKSSQDNESGEDELLLKSSFITLLDTAVSQEHNSIVTYLCKKCTKNEDSVIQEAYKEALSDDKIIKQINKQILRNINGADKGRRSKEQKMYDTILQTALHVNNMKFVAKILDSIESKPQLLTTDQDGKNFLRDSLIAILEHAEGRIFIEKRMSAKPDGNVKKIYTEVYNNRKALDPTQKTDTTVSMEQDSTELNFQGKDTMTKERKNPTAQEELPLSNDKDDSGIDSGSATGSDTSLSGGVLTDDESQDEESKDQKPVKQVHFQNDSQPVLVKEITPHSTSNEELGASQLNQDDETPGHKFKLRRSLYDDLQAKNEKGEYYENAKSGETSRKDLSRNGIIINGVKIPAGDINELYKIYDENTQDSLITMATNIFTLAFQDVQEKVPATAVPVDSIIQELVINYNQSGYWTLIPIQINSILCAANLMLPTINYTSSINYTDSSCVSIEFYYSGYIAPCDDGGKELCKLSCTLEFKLKATDKGLVYEDATILLKMPEKFNGKELRSVIGKYLSDEDIKIEDVSYLLTSSTGANEKRDSEISTTNSDKGTVNQHSQSKSKKTYRNALFTTAIATFTVVLTATAAALVFTAICHETMPITLVEAVETYSLGIALIAACCLVVTAIIYCCTKPSNLLDNNNIEGRSNLQTVAGS